MPNIFSSAFKPIFATDAAGGQSTTHRNQPGLDDRANPDLPQPVQGALGKLFSPFQYTLVAASENSPVATAGAAPVSSGPPSEDANEAAAIRVLLNNGSLITNDNGAIGNVELQAAAKGELRGMSDLPQAQQDELKSAARYYLDHDDRFKQMETIQVAAGDGACNVDDLKLRERALTGTLASNGSFGTPIDGNRAAQVGPGKGARNPVDADEVAAIRVLLNNGSLITNDKGAIGNAELQAAAKGDLLGMSDLPQAQQDELKSAARYYLDHDDRFKQMETIQGAAGDGACNTDDLILRMGVLVA